MTRRFIVTNLALSAALVLALGTAPAIMAGEEESMTSKVFGSIDIAPGDHTGDVSTVNGSVHIGANAVVGNAHAVNGSVHLDARASATGLETVNGSVNVEEHGHVTGDVSSVNGTLRIENGADVSGDVHNVNGAIHVAAARVGGSIRTTAGGIELGPDAHIDGGVVIEEDSGTHFGEQHIPRVVIAPGTVVKGSLRFERKVVLYVSDRATIGPVKGAEVLKFSGAQPPG